MGVACVALGPAASLASAREGYVTSFDGTRIAYHFFPAEGLKSGQRAPTVMNGPGYSSAGAGESDAVVRGLRKAGYNVLTWDPRGFGQSGGNVEIDSPDYEGRDAAKLVDMLAQQPEVQLEKPGDPRLGMAGGSYGGGIQWVLAAADARVDVITPTIAWNSLLSSLNKNDTAKGGWGSILFAAGGSQSTSTGITNGLNGSPSGFQIGRSQDPAVTRAFFSGLSGGRFSESDKEFFAARGPAHLLDRIRVPTLISQATPDTLFTLHEAIENYRAVRRNGVPLKMLWYCKGGGHGVCPTDNSTLGASPEVQNAVLAWLNRYLKGDRRIDTGPRFEWVSDTGARHGGDDYPLPAGAPWTASGAGTLPLIPGSSSGALIFATPAANALDIPLPKVDRATQVAAEPTLKLTYTGTAPSPDARIYAQIVNSATNGVAGQTATPIPVNLDGKEHSLTIPLEGVALDLTPRSSFRLQLTDGSNLYFAQRQAGVVSFKEARISVPTVAPGASRRTGLLRAPSCLARRVKINTRNIGRLKLGQTRARTARRAQPLGTVSRRARVLRYCVKRDRKARGVAVFDARGRLRLAATNARRHTRRGIGPGSSVRTLRKRFRGRVARVRGNRNLHVVRGRGRTRVLFGVRAGRVRYVAIADRKLASRRRTLLAFVRRTRLR